jgi:hypothetical protein
MMGISLSFYRKRKGVYFVGTTNKTRIFTVSGGSF